MKAVNAIIDDDLVDNLPQYEDGEKNTGANRNRVPNPENPIGANELIREEKKEVILDEETIRWRNERKKKYPRSSTDKTNGKKTEE